MDQSADIPYTKGMNYGMGVNLLNGDIPGKAVTPGSITGPTGATGQTTKYDVVKIETLENLYSAIGVSVEVSGHFCFFSAEGKFAYAKESKFNSQATFLLAKCVVENAFTQAEDSQIKPEASELIRQGKSDAFQSRYGDGFVRGMQTGGEFFAVISITSSSKEEEETIAAEIEAGFNILFASADLDTKLNVNTKSKIARNEVRVSTYQRGGKGDEQSFTQTIDDVMARLKVFPSQVEQNPVPYSVQVANYNTLALPEGPNPIDIQAQKEALEDYARLHFKLLSLRNDIEFVQQHPKYFLDPPDSNTLNQWSEFVTSQLNQLTRQASKCAGNPVGGCDLFSFKLPDGYREATRKLTNAVTLKAGANSWPLNLPIIRHDAPKDFQVQVKMLARFDDPQIDGLRGVGLGIFSEKLKRPLVIFRTVNAEGQSVLAFTIAMNGTDPGARVGTGQIFYNEDEIFFRISKKGDQVIDMSISRDSVSWTVFAENLDLLANGFEADDTYKVIFTGYSTDDKSVTGEFSDLSIVEI